MKTDVRVSGTQAPPSLFIKVLLIGSLTAMLVMVMLIAISAVLFVGRWDNEDPVARIERLMGMELPQEIEEVYYYYQQDFSGSFDLYAIYELKEEPKQFLESYSFEEGIVQSLKDQQHNMPYFTQYVPDEFYLCFDNEQYIYHYKFLDGGGDGHLAYFPDKLMIRVVCQIH